MAPPDTPGHPRQSHLPRLSDVSRKGSVQEFGLLRSGQKRGPHPIGGRLVRGGFLRMPEEGLAVAVRSIATLSRRSLRRTRYQYAGGGTRTLKGLLPPDFELCATQPSTTYSAVLSGTRRGFSPNGGEPPFPFCDAQYRSVTAQSRHSRSVRGLDVPLEDSWKVRISNHQERAGIR